MAANAAKARKPSPAQKPLSARKPSRRSAWARTTLLALAAVGLSLMIAAWITNTEFPTLASAALPVNADRATFEDRFIPGTASADRAALQPLKRSILARVESQFSTARDALASRWPQDLRTAIADDEPAAPAFAMNEPAPASP